MIEFPILLDAKNLIIVFVAVIHAALGIVISIKGSGKKQNSIFAIMEFFLILWSIAMIFYRSSYGDEITLWVKLLYFAAIMVPYIFIYFTYAYLRLIKLYFESSGQTKAQIKFVFLGTFFSTILATSSNMLLPIFGIFYLNWFGQVSIVAMAISIAYAITRHNLLNTRVVTTEIFITLINIIILIRFIGSTSPEEFIFNGLVLLGVIMFSFLLIRSVLHEVRQREEISKLAEDLRVANAELKKLDQMKSEFEPTQMEGIIQSGFEEFMEVVKEKKLELRHENPETPLAKAMLDKDKFKQVIMNLVDNAVKYTPEGSVTLKIEEEKEKGNVLFSVSDTGVGMSKGELDGIFKRFSRGESGSKVNTSGLGLGLYLAKRIVTDHGGEIWATSDGPGKGSTFWVRVPVHI